MRWIIVILACAAAVQARPQVGRTLSATRTCTKWCEPGGCVLDKTTGNAVCRKCQNRMVPIRSGADAGGCGCPAGRYFAPGANDADATCKDCELGAYCTSKPYLVPDTQTATMGSAICGANLTTKKKRSTLERHCVTKPGFKYVPREGTTKAKGAACNANTFNVGLNYAETCTPCPAGFSTNGVEGSDSPQDCLVPPGYFLAGPGQVAPCPRGSFQIAYLKTGDAAKNKCTPCPEGITTKKVASIAAADCKWLLPGYYASGKDDGATSPTEGALIGTLCPVGFICPGSDDADTTSVVQVAFTFSDTGPVPSAALTEDAKVKRCDEEFYFKVNAGATAAALWTRTLGAKDQNECFIPPGHYVENEGAEIYTVTACKDDEYQEDWVKPKVATATKCLKCGAGILSDAIIPLKFPRVGTAGGNADVEELSINIRGSSDACYLSKGWGMYYVLDPTNAGKYVFKAQKCNNNNYGATANKAYGLTATPCKNCPVGMKSLSVLWSDADDVSRKDSNNVELAIRDGTSTGALFVHPLSCVTKAGYGYDGRSATLCPAGTYSIGGNHDACTPCNYGYTSAAGAESDAGCKIAPGFGWYSGKVELCPKGTYNQNMMDDEQECSKCTGVKANSYTTDLGADHADECSVCAPGYGGNDVNKCADCATAAGYGPEFRADTMCITCPTQDIGFSFFYKGELIPYKSAPVVRSKATSPADCVSNYAQIESGLWYLAGASSEVATATKLADCVAACANTENTDKCMFATFKYTQETVAGTPEDTTGVCSLALSGNSGTGLTAFKAVPAGDVGAASVKSVSTGLYTQWQFAGTSIGMQTEEITGLEVNSKKSKAKAFEACDNDIACAGVYCTEASVDSDEIGASGTCKKIKGVSSPEGTEAAMRSLTRAVPAKFQLTAA